MEGSGVDEEILDADVGYSWAILDNLVPESMGVSQRVRLRDTGELAVTGLGRFES